MRKTTTIPPGFRDSPQTGVIRGEVVASTYAVHGEISRTESGIVFEARDMMLDRMVAFKLAWRDAGLPSLILEARRCAAVRDPVAVAVYGMGNHFGMEYVVGERVVGTLLRDKLAEPLSTGAYMALFRKLVAAVTIAHDARIAVGDVSGATVLIGPDGRIVFGRLSLSQVPALQPHGRIVAPELARGEVDPADPSGAEAIDLYALGCVALELAVGTPPFANDNPEIELLAHGHQPPPRLADLRADLPGELSDLVEWLVAKDPAARPRSAADVLAQIDSLIERIGAGKRSLRVLVVDDDTGRARWLCSLARRAHPGAMVEIASEGGDAAHKLNRDHPDLVFIDAELRGMMNALELVMYARGLEGGHNCQLVLIGELGARDRVVFEIAEIATIADDAQLAFSVLDRVRATAADPPPPWRPKLMVSG